jgi:Protein of unknown function (DUF1566)
MKNLNYLSYFILFSFLIFNIISCDEDSNAGNNSNNTNNNNSNLSYPIVETEQAGCFDSSDPVGCVDSDNPFSGQDAQYKGLVTNYTDNGNGTISDNVTGLMWIKTPDTTGDGTIDATDKMTYEQALAYPDTLNAMNFGGHNDWRLPSIKEQYSLIMFYGTDPSSGDESNLVPFIDTGYFDFAYGDTASGERTIDSQYATTSLYVGNSTLEDLLFGVNFADGRIKGYGLQLMGEDKTFLVLCVRGNESYGENDFVDNEDNTISDLATGLMWSKQDSATGMNWEEALNHADEKNSENYLGYNDWRLPNAKELHSIVDYSRSPESSDSPAINPLFESTSIINEDGVKDWPYIWTSTTHIATSSQGTYAVYISFGRALGYMNNNWVDVHGAGAQRSDPKVGNPADFPEGFGPQGDAIRIYNYVRLVRDGATYDTSVLSPETCGDGTCVDGETSENCPNDCETTSDGTCGDGTCDGTETIENCAIDCAEGPTTCEYQSDCEVAGACPDDAAKGCSCEPFPLGGNACVPLCDQVSDCPSPPDGMTFTCNNDGICVPQ